jgi:hypothetical protein
VRLVNGALAIVLLATAQAAAQQPQPGVWFGISRSSTGRPTNERFEVEARATDVVIRSAPFGKTPSSWGPISLRQDGSIEFLWTGKPPLSCVLRRSDPRNYGGTCHGSGQTNRRLTLTRNRPPLGLELPVLNTDFRILARVRQILSGPSVWNRHDDRACEDDAKQNSWSVFCALYQASVDVTGMYLHLRPVIMETRAAVGEMTIGRELDQPLKDYNNLESTTYADIAMIFDRTKKRLQARKACADSPKRFVDPKGDTAPSGGDVVFWRENVGYTVQKKSYQLNETYEVLGPMATSGKVPNDWLAASIAVTRRSWKRSGFGGVDAKGKLRNGNHWRYFYQCGESLKYYDVPAEAAAFFDRMIDGVYLRRGHR